MIDTVESLILDLLEWIGPQSRPYREVIEVWRTSCPRLPVWEEANERGFIDHYYDFGRGKLVIVSPQGQEHLRTARTHSQNL
jgi:hypothetical protein